MKTSPIKFRVFLEEEISFTPYRAPHCHSNIPEAVHWMAQTLLGGKGERELTVETRISTNLNLISGVHWKH